MPTPIQMAGTVPSVKACGDPYPPWGEKTDASTATLHQAGRRGEVQSHADPADDQPGQMAVDPDNE